TSEAACISFSALIRFRRRTGAPDAAAAAYDRAIAATGNAVERAELQRRRAAV
ncbi:MAG: hypothetical protein JWR63_372, partial [Conexibacter sp.]|nr:hypothetical protein [Conexibacter sp.]